MELKPFETIHIITTDNDAEHIKLLFSDEVEEGIICGICGSTRFITEAFCTADVDMIVDKGRMVVCNIKEKEVMINRVVKCAVCGAETDFIPLKKVTGSVL